MADREIPALAKRAKIPMVCFHCGRQFEDDDPDDCPCGNNTRLGPFDDAVKDEVVSDG